MGRFARRAGYRFRTASDDRFPLIGSAPAGSDAEIGDFFRGKLRDTFLKAYLSVPDVLKRLVFFSTSFTSSYGMTALYSGSVV